MKSLFCDLWTVLIILAVFVSLLLGERAVQAELLRTYDFESAAAMTKAIIASDASFGTWSDSGAVNVRPGRTDSGISRVFDAALGSYVTQYSGGGFIRLGTLPDLTQETDYSISFYVSNSAATDADQIIVGNRSGVSGGEKGNYNFCKIRPSSTAYCPQSKIWSIGYPVLSSDWSLVQMVKSDSTLSVFVNGTKKGSMDLANGGTYQTLYSATVNLGGDSYGSGGENWTNGKLDQVQIFNHALTTEEVAAQYQTFTNRKAYAQSPTEVRAVNLMAAQPASTRILDTFDGDALSTNVWTVEPRGLNAAEDPGFAASVADGHLVLSGTATTQHWRGVSVKSNETFTASAGNEVTVSVGRVALSYSPSATGARSSLWLVGENGKFVHFAQNKENGPLWSYNLNDVDAGGEGMKLAKSGTTWSNSLDYHEMTIKHDGKSAWLYVDGELLGIADVSFTQFAVRLTGTSRAIGDQVTAVFDHPTVTQRSGLPAPAEIRDTFANEQLNSIWQTTGTVSGYSSATLGKLNDGTVGKRPEILVMRGESEARYGMPYENLGSLTFSVDRDSMKNVSGTTSGLKLLGSSDENYLSLAQNSDGEWNLSWGSDLALSDATGTLTGDQLLTTTDSFTKQLMFSLEDGANAGDAQKLTVSIDAESFIFAVEGLSDALSASLFTTGANAYAGFDDFGVTGTQLPEPAAWLLLVLGTGLGFWSRRPVRRLRGLIRLHSCRPFKRTLPNKKNSFRY